MGSREEMRGRMRIVHGFILAATLFWGGLASLPHHFSHAAASVHYSQKDAPPVSTNGGGCLDPDGKPQPCQPGG